MASDLSSSLSLLLHSEDRSELILFLTHIITSEVFIPLCAVRTVSGGLFKPGLRPILTLEKKFATQEIGALLCAAHRRKFMATSIFVFDFDTHDACTLGASVLLFGVYVELSC
jgi:hypothetical protein